MTTVLAFCQWADYYYEKDSTEKENIIDSIVFKWSGNMFQTFITSLIY